MEWIWSSRSQPQSTLEPYNFNIFRFAVKVRSQAHLQFFLPQSTAINRSQAAVMHICQKTEAPQV